MAAVVRDNYCPVYLIIRTMADRDVFDNLIFRFDGHKNIIILLRNKNYLLAMSFDIFVTVVKRNGAIDCAIVRPSPTNRVPPNENSYGRWAGRYGSFYMRLY